MSMSMHATAVIPPTDDKFDKMLKAYRACEAAGLDIPEEVDDFFDGEPPDPKGICQDIGHLKRFSGSNHESCKDYFEDMVEGFEIDVTKLPPGTKLVRVYCCY